MYSALTITGIRLSGIFLLQGCKILSVRCRVIVFLGGGKITSFERKAVI